MRPSVFADKTSSGLPGPSGVGIEANSRAIWGVLVLGVVLSFWDVATVHQLYPAGTPEGVAIGWWWCLSVSWLAAAFERGGEDDAQPPRRSQMTDVPTIRFYLVAAFSLLGLVDCVQHGYLDVLGFLIGAGTFAVLFAIAELGVHLLRNRLELGALGRSTTAA